MAGILANSLSNYLWNGYAFMEAVNGTGEPVAPSGYRFFSASGYIGGTPSPASSTTSVNWRRFNRQMLDGLPFRVTTPYNMPPIYYTSRYFDDHYMSGATTADPNKYYSWTTKEIVSYGVFHPFHSLNLELSGAFKVMILGRGPQYQSSYSGQMTSYLGSVVPGSVTGSASLIGRQISASHVLSAVYNSSTQTVSLGTQTMRIHTSWDSFVSQQYTYGKNYPLRINGVNSPTANQSGFVVLGSGWTASGFAPISAYDL